MTGAVFTSQKIFAEHDADRSGTMDMFEMRQALSKQGNVSLIFAIKVLAPVLSCAAWTYNKLVMLFALQCKLVPCFKCE